MIGWGTLFKKNIAGYEPAQGGGQGTEVNQFGRREIRPRLYQDVCGLCGRTILTGENTTLYANPDDGNPVIVCPHCRQQARESGYQQAA